MVKAIYRLHYATYRGDKMRTNINIALKTYAYHYLNGNDEAMERIQRKIEKHDTKQDNAHTREMKRRDKDE